MCGEGFRELTEGERVRFEVELDPKGKGKGKSSMKGLAVSVI